MLPVIKNLRFVFVMLLSLSTVSLSFYFATDRTRSNSLGKLPSGSTSIESQPDHHAPRPLANSVSLDSDHDGIPDRGPLGEKLFRTDFGSYQTTDHAETKFSEFADVRTLKNFNSQFISRDRQYAQPGDLLFYHQIL